MFEAQFRRRSFYLLPLEFPQILMNGCDTVTKIYHRRYGFACCLNKWISAFSGGILIMKTSAQSGTTLAKNGLAAAALVVCTAAGFLGMAVMFSAAARAQDADNYWPQGANNAWRGVDTPAPRREGRVAPQAAAPAPQSVGNAAPPTTINAAPQSASTPAPQGAGNITSQGAGPQSTVASKPPVASAPAPQSPADPIALTNGGAGNAPAAQGAAGAVPVAPPVPAAAPAAAAAGWSVGKGQTLRDVLKGWSDTAGVDLFWSITYDYRINDDMSFPGTYDEAVGHLLDKFSAIRPQPYAELHAGKPRVLVIKSYDLHPAAPG